MNNENNSMTRQELEQEHIDHMISKWGESERDGIEKIVRKKSLGTLRVQTRVREMECDGNTEQDIREMVSQSPGPKGKISSGCLEHGMS